VVISAQQAEQSVRVIAPDLPGHGRSEGQLLDSASAYAAWLEDFCRALNLSAFFLMGTLLVVQSPRNMPAAIRTK